MKDRSYRFSLQSGGCWCAAEISPDVGVCCTLLLSTSSCCLPRLAAANFTAIAVATAHAAQPEVRLEEKPPETLGSSANASCSDKSQLRFCACLDCEFGQASRAYRLSAHNAPAPGEAIQSCPQVSCGWSPVQGGWPSTASADTTWSITVG